MTSSGSGLGRGHLFERRDGLLRVELLVEPDNGVEDDDGEDGDGVHPFAQQAGDDTGGDENPDDQALELAEKNLEQADAFAFLQPVNGFLTVELRAIFYGFPREVKMHTGIVPFHTLDPLGR